jgi:hypothetical protein
VIALSPETEAADVTDAEAEVVAEEADATEDVPAWQPISAKRGSVIQTRLFFLFITGFLPYYQYEKENAFIVLKIEWEREKPINKGI